jgi:hypothetical protein
MDLRSYLQTFNGRAGAADSSIVYAEQQLGSILPSEYKEFLRTTNGGEGFVGERYVILYPVEELASANKDYMVQEFAPGLVIFGSDGGGEAFGFDTRTPQRAVVMISFVGMEWAEAKPLGANFNEFLIRLHRGRLFENE